VYLCNYKERIENKKVAALIAGRKMEGTYTAAACTCREIIMKRKELWKNGVNSSAEKVVSLILGITCRRLLCLTRFFTVYTYACAVRWRCHKSIMNYIPFTVHKSVYLWDSSIPFSIYLKILITYLSHKYCYASQFHNTCDIRRKVWTGQSTFSYF